MQIKESIKKIQNLPDGQKERILWSIVAVVGIILFIFWLNSAKKNFQSASLSGTLPKFNSSSNNPDLQNQGKKIEDQAQKLLDQLDQQQNIKTK